MSESKLLTGDKQSALVLSRKMLFLFLFLILGSLAAYSQGSLGTIAGTVKDTNGAIVKGASVTVTNEASNESKQATTNESGVFVIPNVQVGNYTIKVTASGFSDATVKGAKVSVAFTKEADITM